ncbi:DUF4468 domain-containing protein [Pontibacter mangrovi]|uniref:DUF4468 domain-containing protein n=1 Tax=Pontibacter mangrovi TaxID=2589816 RepID=A0A501W4R5_9BACT|nr:DUF4468 domain-containing protein [Pontibacter mangrovi]TPE44933.1 DUF4468 domain-containing protein [Pontibacter mangrovi]
MKYAFTLLALLCALTCYAQNYEYKGIRNFPVNERTGKVTYEGVVPAEGMSAHQLYSAAKEWIARNSDARYAIETEVPGEKIIGKGSVAQSNFNGHTHSYDFILSFKDGRYKYELTNFVLQYDYGTPATRGSFALEDYPKQNLSGRRAQKLDTIYQGLDQDFKSVAAVFEAFALDVAGDDW